MSLLQRLASVIMLLSPGGSDTLSDAIIMDVYPVLRNADVFEKINEELLPALSAWWKWFGS